MAERILHTEEVVSGEKARWPFITSGADKYVQPTREGFSFYGWKYNGSIKRPSDYSSESNNPFGPITTDNTKIYAIWKREDVVVYITCNHSNISDEGDTDSDLTKISYWAESGGRAITDGVTLESVPLDSGQTAISFTDKGTSVVSNKNVKSIKVSSNTEQQQKYLKYRAKYNDKYSTTITITQDAAQEYYQNYATISVSVRENAEGVAIPYATLSNVRGVINCTITGKVDTHSFNIDLNGMSQNTLKCGNFSPLVQMSNLGYTLSDLGYNASQDTYIELISGSVQHGNRIDDSTCTPL